MKNRINQLIKSILILIWMLPIHSQGHNFIRNDTLLIDSGILHGRLENGLTYYIKPLKGVDEVEMNLWVKAGSFNQSDSQKSVAHLIEHLPFRSTKHFPGDNIKLNPLIKKHGIKDFSGRTIGVHTEYQLSVPSSSGIEGLSTGLLWFTDIGKLDISDYNVEKEAGIIRQEAIYKSGDLIDWIFSNKKRESQVYPCTPDLSTFFTDIENISPAEVDGFYKKWYRPDRMGLVIIGNIKNTEVLEHKIRTHFSNIPVSTSLNPKCDCNKRYLQQESQFAIVESIQSGWIKDDNLPVEVFLTYRKQDALNNQVYSKKVLQANLLWDAIGRLISRRFSSKSKQSFFVDQNKREKPFLQIVISEKNGKVRQRIQESIGLLHQAQVFGFTKEEWNLVQGIMIEEYLNKSDTSSVNYWNKQIKNHYVYGEALPENKPIRIKQILKSITLSHINNFIKRNLHASPDDISMMAPRGNKVLSHTEAEVRDWIQEAIGYPISPYVRTVQHDGKVIKLKNASLMTKEGIGALAMTGIRNMGVDPITGVEVLKLDNGIKILLDKSGQETQTSGSISIHGFVAKGANCYKKKDYYSAINAPDIIQDIALKDNAIVYINNLTSGIKIRGDEKNTELLFQQIYLCFDPPRRPTTMSFKQWKERAKKQYFVPSYDLIGTDFMNNIKSFMGDKSFIPKGTMRFYGIEKTKLNMAHKIYNDIFSTASNFTFLISGNFETGQILSLVQKYIGNLPISLKNQAIDNISCNKYTHVSLPSAPLYKEFYAEDIQPAYSMRSVNYELSYMVRNVEEIWNWKEYIKLLALSKFITPRLKKLRYKEKAGLYGNSYSYIKFNKGLKSFKIAIYLACKEDELNWLRRECQKIVMDIRENGINQNEFDEISKSNIYPYFLTDSNSKPTSAEIYNYYRFSTPIIDKEERENYVHSLTPDDIQETASKYFSQENMYEFVMKNSEVQN